MFRIDMISLATGILLVVTALPLWRHQHWAVRAADFLRLQLACASLVLLVVQLAFLDLSETQAWLKISIVVFCLSWHLCWIMPYTCFWPRTESKWAVASSVEDELTILTANVLAPNHNACALLALTEKHQPDVVLTLESDSWWQDKLDTLESDMSYSMKAPLDNLYGMHVYSRLPLEECEIKYLVDTQVPSMHTLLTMRSGQQVRMHFLHPAPPSPTENTTSRERDAELVIVAQSVSGSDQPIVVTGDLNDVAWSSTTRLFRKLSGLLDPRVGRGMYNTFHAAYPIFRWPLDHLFHSHHFTLASIERLPSFGSDHFALLTKLVCAPQRSLRSAGLDTKKADHEWAETITDRKKVVSQDVPEPGE